MGPLVRALCDGVKGRDLRGFVIVPVPAHRGRRRHRGFDLAELLAARVGRELGLVVAQPLLRNDEGSQRGRGRDERSTIACVLRHGAPQRVLLIDDVVTTGSTIKACATTLRGGGAKYVGVMSLAITPRTR